MASAHVPEDTAHVTSLLHGDDPAEQDRRNEPAPRRGERIDLLPDELLKHPRTLRVSDQDDAASLVEAAHVLLPGGEHVPIGGEQRNRGWRAAEPLERQLAVHGCEDAAALGEARRL